MSEEAEPVEGVAVTPPRDPRDPVIPRAVITIIALFSAGGMLVNVYRGGSPTNTLILASVVCSTWGIDWFLKWAGR